MLLPYLNKDVIEAGCDEAGRGCLAGSVYAAAVILPPDYQNERLNDSKQLNEKMRYELREEIQHDAVDWAVGIVTAQEIDQINILKASILAMHRAIDQLKVRPQELIIDGNKFFPYKDIHHTTVVKGDGKYLSIAAASMPCSYISLRSLCTSTWLGVVSEGTLLYVPYLTAIVPIYPQGL